MRLQRRTLPTAPSPAPTRRRRAALLAALAVVGVVATGCAAGGGGDSSSSGDAGVSTEDRAAVGGPEAAPEGGGDAAKAAPDAESAAGGDNGTVSPVELGDPAQLARKAAIALQVKNIAEASSKVRAIAATADGLVLSENIGSSTDTPVSGDTRVSATTYGEIAISVPSSKLDATLDELSRLGTLVRRDSSSENVGQQIVDTDTRTKSMQASVDRIRALMTQTKDIGQVVQLEGELSRRTAELESLKAQLASLKGSVARSPIQVSLSTDSGLIEEEKDASTGFLAGLAGGWAAFSGSIVVVLTVLGAVLPFLMALALLVVPLVWWSRRRRPAPVVVAAAAPPPPPAV